MSDPTGAAPGATPPAAKSSGGGVVRILVVLIFIGLLGFFGWTRLDAKSVESVNAARQELASVAKALTGDPAPEEAALRSMHERLAALATGGGLVGPEQLHPADHVAFARETAQRAAALMPVVALAAGDLDRAKADLEKAPADAGELGPLLANARRFVEAMANAKPEERTILRRSFLAGLRGGARAPDVPVSAPKTGAPKTAPLTVETAKREELEALVRTAVNFQTETEKRVAAVEAIAKHEGSLPLVVKALLNLRGSSQPAVAAASEAAFKKLDPKKLAALLDAKNEKGEDDEETRSLALEALATADLDAAALVALAAAIGSAARGKTTEDALALLKKAGVGGIEGFARAAEAPGGKPGSVLSALGDLPESARPQLAPVVLEILRGLSKDSDSDTVERAVELLPLEPPPSGDEFAALLDPARPASCREPVVKLVERLGPKAKKTVPALMKCLGEEELGWRATAAIVAIGEAPGLAAAIDSGSKTARKNAVGVARGLPAAAREVIPALLRAAAEDGLATAASGALQNLEVAELTPHLDAIGKIMSRPGGAANSVMDLVTKLGPAAKPILPQLGEWIAAAEPNEFLFGSALAMFKAMKLTPAENATVLAGALGAKSDAVVGWTAGAIGEAPGKGDEWTRAIAPAIPALVKGLERPRAGTRQNCAWALRQVGLKDHADAAKAAVPALVKLLADSDRAVRCNAVYTLQTLGAVADPAAAGLIERAREEDAEIHAAAIQALCGLSKEAVASSVLAGFLADKAPATRAYVCWALSLRKADAAVAVDRLAAAISDADATVRYQAIKALQQIGDAARSAAPAIGKAVADVDLNVRSLAAYVLRVLTDPSAETTAKLFSALKDENVYVRQYAGIALGLGGDGRPEVVTVLVEVLEKSGDAVDRKDAVRACAKLGAAAKDALPALEKVAANDDALKTDAAAAIEAVKKGG